MRTTKPHVPDPSQLAQPAGDPLGEILHLLKLTGTFYCQCRLSAPWGIQVPAFEDVMTFVVVTGGRFWLTLDRQEPMLLEQGNLVLLTSHAAHRFQSDPEVTATSLDDLPVQKISEIYETLDFGGGGAISTLMYGIVRIDHAASGLLMNLLPDVLTVDSWNDEADSWLQGTLRFIASEARTLRPGGETVITRLADVVVIQAIRNWINTAPEANTGWLKGARDPKIGKAIIAIHRAPAHNWTVETLAQTAGMSRSTFSARFTNLVGQSAMHYLTTWRMRVARARLLETKLPISEVAFEVGYQSEPAFCRAFKRVFWENPGQARRKAQTLLQEP